MACGGVTCDMLSLLAGGCLWVTLPGGKVGVGGAGRGARVTSQILCAKPRSRILCKQGSATGGLKAGERPVKPHDGGQEEEEQ